MKQIAKKEFLEYRTNRKEILFINVHGLSIEQLEKHLQHIELHPRNLTTSEQTSGITALVSNNKSYATKKVYELSNNGRIYYVVNTTINQQQKEYLNTIYYVKNVVDIKRIKEVKR